MVWCHCHTHWRVQHTSPIILVYDKASAVHGQLRYGPQKVHHFHISYSKTAKSNQNPWKVHFTKPSIYYYLSKNQGLYGHFLLVGSMLNPTTCSAQKKLSGPRAMCEPIVRCCASCTHYRLPQYVCFQFKMKERSWKKVWILSPPLKFRFNFTFNNRTALMTAVKARAQWQHVVVRAVHVLPRWSRKKGSLLRINSQFVRP